MTNSTARNLSSSECRGSARTLSAADLYSNEGLQKIDGEFLAFLRSRIPQLANRLLQARAGVEQLSEQQESAVLVALAPEVEEFLAGLFAITAEVRTLQSRHAALEPLFTAKKHFIVDYALPRLPDLTLAEASGADLRAELALHLGVPFSELALAKSALGWMFNQKEHAAALAAAVRYTAWALRTPEGQQYHQNSVLFRVHGKHDPAQRVATSRRQTDGIEWLSAPAGRIRQRDGFQLTDSGCDFAAGMAEAKHCILCHNQGRDSCSKGARTAHGAPQVTHLGTPRLGCPLGQKISEMHEVRLAGRAIGALAMICVDNPMVAGTGHRICNDCMVGCIFENESLDPVDVPQSETRILKDVLSLPWGVEIYSLLTRWNPLNLRRPLPQPDSGKTVLVVGMGPSGYTLAHHLMNDGHSVVAVDALKIEPMRDAWLGTESDRFGFGLIKESADLLDRLDQRVSAGFGGVGEYGITVRWDKNFLTIIRLLLQRRQQFALYGGVRFGSSLTLDSARELGFSHVALCMGAGRPTVLEIPNGLAGGVRTASDFLMALQLTGAAREDSLANLQLRLPVLVIGGGLTAIDACTEALAYYPVQVEKFLVRYQRLCVTKGTDSVRSCWSTAEAATADEFIGHALALRAERSAAAREGREPNIVGLLQSWGGAQVVYRRRLVDSPAYRNPEEISKAFEEGVRFSEQLTPISIEVDGSGNARGLRARHASGGEEVYLAAGSILLAAGTSPNTVLAREDGRFELDGKYFQAVDESGRPVSPERSVKAAEAHVLTRIDSDGFACSFFGDLHPSFGGTVVGAMASAKRGYPVLSRLLRQCSAPMKPFSAIKAAMDGQVIATIVEIEILGPNIVEICVRAFDAARAFKPGQFFRLQNFESHASNAGGSKLVMEGLAVTAAAAEPDRGLLWLVVLEMGGSSNFVRDLKIGEQVVLMGPTGEPTHIPTDETVMLAGGGLGNAVLFSVGTALRQAGSRVLYFAGYRTREDAFRTDYLEHAADEIVWCVDHGELMVPGRPQDHAFKGNVVQAMRAFASGQLGPSSISFASIDRIIAIGSDRMMAAVNKARAEVLAPYLKSGHVALASINSPMQCMMKEICGQCLQKHRDPVTGVEKIIFSCANQDQNMDLVDFSSLHDRLGQNAVQEKLVRTWIQHIRALATPVDRQAS